MGIIVQVLGLHPRLCMHAYVFCFFFSIWRCWGSGTLPVCSSVTVHIDSVHASCAWVLSVCVCVCVSLRGMTGERGVNLNAGHCAACRFRFCLSALFCAQDGNPSNMARIPIKSNSPLPATIEDCQLRGDRWCIQRTWQVTLQSASSHTLMCFSGFGLRLFCPFAWGQNWQGHWDNWIDVGMCVCGHQLLI